jgi:hypothetical protein
MIRVTDQYFWNVIFALFFLTLIIMGVIILEGETTYKSVHDATLIDIALISLASFRFIRLFVYDAITKFFREQFWDAKEMKTKVVLEKPAGGPRRTLADLLSCPWCFGMWAAATVTFFYFLTPYAFYPTLFFAIAGVASLLQIFSNKIGWDAEKAKKETELL